MGNQRKTCATSNGHGAAYLREMELDLMQRREELQADTDLRRDDTLVAAKDHTADFFATASLDLLQSVGIRLRDRKQDAIRAIDKAITRIRHGQFGECTECGEKISAERLKVLPTAEVCMQCKEAEEKLAAAQVHSDECQCPFPHHFAVWDMAFALRGQS